MSILWIYDTLKKSFGIEHNLSEYLKESVGCQLLHIFPSDICAELCLFQRSHQNIQTEQCFGPTRNFPSAGLNELKKDSNFFFQF